MDLQEYIKDQISYYETQEKARTHEMIDTLKTIAKELLPKPEKPQLTDPIELKAFQYLKDLKVK
jgi:hypothetical protein